LECQRRQKAKTDWVKGKGENTGFWPAVPIISVIAVTHTTIAYAAMPNEPIAEPVANAWSEPVNGLSGRLRVEFEDLKPGLRHAVYLELRNHSLAPIAVINQPQIHAQLHDSFGKPVSTTSFPMSGPLPNPQWAVIPRDAYIGFRVDMQTVGVPTREHGMALFAVGGKCWGLRAGKYLLQTMLVFKKEGDGPQNQWLGELNLPTVQFTITMRMLRPTKE
jgi:hypothetical protein